MAPQYILRIQCKQAGSSIPLSAPLTKEGDWIWVVKEPGNWIEATGYRCNSDPEQIPKNVRKFPSPGAAKKFANHWAGHPWYYKPNGIYEVIQVKQTFEQVHTGYLRTGELEQVHN